MDAENGLSQFAQDMQQQVMARAAVEGEEEFKENVFTEVAVEYLAEAGELDDVGVCAHRARGVQVNGYAISDISEDDQQVDLLVTVHTDEVPPRTVTRAEAGAAFRRARAFLRKALEGYHYTLEPSTAVFDLAQRLHNIKGSITRVRFLLLTDGVVKSHDLKDSDLAQTRVSHHIWDAERLYRCWSSGHRREIIEIDFVEALGAPIPCLVQPELNPEYATYLAVFPGSALVELYGRYGPRLLERNVRSYLQARGKINAGIRRTVRGEPHMFLAFNNGLSITAEAVDLMELPSGGTGISRVRDLQIVNGGQTTASIYHAAKRDKADVSQVFVQAKLTVMTDPSQMDEVVPKISAFANTQNRIQVADLQANSAYHRRVEELSRTIWAPAKDGTQHQTRWYYERARGQFRDELTRERTPARQREFLTIHPKAQMFTKTDLAKFLHTWDQLPHTVSRGAQTCFSDFTGKLEAHVRSEGSVDGDYFQRLIAQAILFRTAERVMRERKYAGYRANLVAYTLARLSHDTRGRVDLGRIWRDQRATPAMEAAIAEVSQHVWEHITRPPGSGNVTQYCKREDCWKSFLEKEILLPQGLRSELLAADRGRTDHVGDSEVEGAARKGNSVASVMAVPSEVWFALVTWSQNHGRFTAIEREVVSDIAVAVGYERRPSLRLATQGMGILERARRSGFDG